MIIKVASSIKAVLFGQANHVVETGELKQIRGVSMLAQHSLTTFWLSCI